MLFTSQTYKPSEYEAEKASNSYLMSLVALIVGVPLPIVNLLATLLFYWGNRKSSYFVRWHCTQALLSQASLVVVNSIGFWWTIGIIFRDQQATNGYFAWIFCLLIFNLIEFIATVHAAIVTRKGQHVSWWLYGELTDMIVRK